MKAKFKFFAKLTALLLVGGAPLMATSVPEPSTLIYGKVLHRANGNETQLTAGSLTWTLSDQEGVEYTFNAELEDIGGVFSYKVAIPHQALSSGLNVDPNVIPLGSGEREYEFESIEVNGYPAAILWSEVDFLNLLQNARAETHRIDLLVSFDLLDTDGDGMPDWWEKFYGLDWQVNDANLDPDGDGRSNLDEYLNGTNPFFDDRSPTLQTLDLIAYGESNNGVWLRASDVDTEDSDISYTLASIPDGGYLHLMSANPNNVAPDLILGNGDSFTQAQLNAGRIAYRHTNPALTNTGFSVTLSDGVNVSELTEVSISVFPPAAAAAIESTPGDAPVWWRDENVVFEAYWGLRENVLSGSLVESALLYLLGKDYGWTLWDQRADTLPVTIEATSNGSHFILGGAAADDLRGGDADDIINGGAGLNTLFGGNGLDLFIISDLSDEVIEDFDATQDVLDLADLLVGQNGTLGTYLKVTTSGADTLIGVDQNGDASGFTDAEILLKGITLSQDDLDRLWSVGQLLAGALQGRPSISIENIPTEPVEEGYSTASLILRRNGPLDAALTVGIVASGSASNGTDYTTLPASIDFAANEETATLTIDPLLDGISENVELVNLNLSSGAGYVLGSVNSAQVSIVDARQRFSILAIDDATVVGGDPAYLQLVRQGPKNGVIELLLSIGGTAERNVDYAAISTLVTFSDLQGSRNIPVEALGLGALGDGETSRTVSVSIRPSFGDEFELGDPSTATVRLLSNQAAFDSWAEEVLTAEQNAQPSAQVQAAATPRTGMQALLEYALSYGIELDDGIDPEERDQLTPQLEHGEDGSMHFEFTKRLNDSRLIYIVECSPDLVSWHSGSEYFEQVPLSDSQENAGRVRYRVVGAEDGAQCFIRVRVELSE